MGDRAYLSITIHGHVDTVERLNTILEAMDSEGLMPANDLGEPMAWMLQAAETGTAPVFHDHECNYAEINTAEDMLQEIGQPYRVSHEEGGGYGAACWSYDPQNGVKEAIQSRDGGPCLSVEDVRKAIEGDDPITAVRALIENADAADGGNLPPFTVSDAVRAHLVAG